MNRKVLWAWALVLSVLSLAGVVGFRDLMPEHHFIAGLRIVFAEPDPLRPKNFDLAIRHFKAIPEGFWVHEVAPAYLLTIEAQRDRMEDFESFTPEQHYAAAVYVCQHAPILPGEFRSFDTDCLLKSPQDLNRAIRHLKAIPRDSAAHEDAARALRLVEVQRDRPGDFESARSADYQQCLTKAYARFSGQGVCGNAIADGCDIFSLTRANNMVIGSYKTPASASNYHWSESELLERVRAAAAAESKP